MHAFDRQTDGQTDRNLIVKTALHSMQRGNKPSYKLVQWRRLAGDNGLLTAK